MALFIVGVVALFQGKWVLLGGSIVAWLILMVIWYSAHRGVERLELSQAQDLSQVTGILISNGDWQGALTASTNAVQVLRKSSRSGAGSAMTARLPRPLSGTPSSWGRMAT